MHIFRASSTAPRIEHVDLGCRISLATKVTTDNYANLFDCRDVLYSSSLLCAPDPGNPPTAFVVFMSIGEQSPV